MAKASPTTTDRPDRKWEIEDALRTITRAREICEDPVLMKAVKKLAGEKAEEMEAVAGKLDGLAKMGLVSDKARAKAMEK